MSLKNLLSPDHRRRYMKKVFESKNNSESYFLLSPESIKILRYTKNKRFIMKHPVLADASAVGMSPNCAGVG